MVPATAAPDTASPAAPAAVGTTAQPTPDYGQAPGRLSWFPEPVALNVQTVIHATGAELGWPSARQARAARGVTRRVFDV